MLLPRAQLSLLASSSLLCAACATSSLTKPTVDVPAAFADNAVGRREAPAWPGKEWYVAFRSDELNSLIEQAEKNNLDLTAAEARVRQADARARVAGAPLLPQLDAGGSATHFQGRSGGVSAHETDWSALLSASYEVDFWGRNRAAANAARSLAVAGRSDRDTLALTTLSGVAKTYFEVLSLRDRIGIAQANLESAREILRAIQARFDAGASTPVELATQKAAVASAAIVIPQLRRQELEARAALALLVGRSTDAFTVTGTDLASIVEPVIDAGLPSELLRRRPDIFAAEANLQAAHADLIAARAALFPALTLTASGGVQNPAVQAAIITLGGTGSSLTVGASLVQAIFDGGRRRGVRDEALAKEDELVAGYRSTILSAFKDVETALGAIRQLDAQRDAQAENVNQSERAFEGARLRYREGATDYLTVFESQRTLQAARDQFSQYQLARLHAVVDLAKALGGGWQVAIESVSNHE